ncbi:LytR/AlgR family response regulator transcription factor [Oleiharenicola lentus]|uniref:LytR/AlgR family response regulator transcription factor n=1 Tax=Oleiharenicola lentus TaxID=2508720 RepID=UPI003F66CACF
MAQLRALLVDDERLARKRLAELLTQHPEIVIVGEADSVESASTAASELKPDVIFLDVEMPPVNGLELLPRLSEESPPAIVFVTAHENFAVQAFTVSALDYLLKPVHRERLALTVRRLLTVKESKSPFPDAAEAAWTLESRVALSDRQLRRTVQVREIVAIQALGAYSRVSIRDVPAMIVLRSISEWERLLPAEIFARIDRSLIVQMPLVRTVERKSRDETFISIEGMSGKLLIGRAAALRLRRQADAEE